MCWSAAIEIRLPPTSAAAPGLVLQPASTGTMTSAAAATAKREVRRQRREGALVTTGEAIAVLTLRFQPGIPATRDPRRPTGAPRGTSRAGPDRAAAGRRPEQ